MKEHEINLEHTLRQLVRHMRHPVKDGLLTLAGDEDCDIPETTANFLMGGAQLELDKFLNGH